MKRLPADFYSRRLRSPPRDYRAFADFTARYLPRASRVIVDVGVGKGDVLNSVKGIAASALTVALDVDTELVRAARAQFDVALADFDTGLPFVGDCADGIILSFVTHLARDRAALFAECHRMLKPEGVTFILTASETDLRLRFLNPFFPSMYDIDLARYGGLTRVKEELHAAGCTVVAVERLPLGTITIDGAFINDLPDAPWSSLALIGDDERRDGIARLRTYYEAHCGADGTLRRVWMRTAVAAVKR